MVFDRGMSQELGIRKSDQVEDADDEDGGLELKAANLVDALRRHYYSLKIQLSFNDNTHLISNISYFQVALYSAKKKIFRRATITS